MKLTIPRTELKDALTGLNKVINKRAPVPVLGCMRLDADGQSVRLTGTSIDQVAMYEIAMTEPVPAPVSVLVPLDALQAVLKTAQGPDIEIEPGRDVVTITSTVAGQGIGRRVETPDIADWPELAVPADTKPVESGFLSSMRQALMFSSTDDSRPLLKSAYLNVDAKAGHRIVATDSRRLSVFPCATLPLAESVIVPSSKFMNWPKLEGETRIGAGKGVFTLRCGPWTFTTKVVEGTFPRYSQVIPDYGKNATTLELSPEDVQLLVQTLPGMPGNEGADGTVILRLSPGSVQVCSKQDAQSPETAIRLEKSECKGAPVSVGLDRRFFKEALLAGFERWQVRDSTSPLVGNTKDDLHACHVLMPVRCANVEDDPASDVAVAPQFVAPAVQPVPKPIQTQETKEIPMPKKPEQPQTVAPEATTSLDRILSAYELAKNAVRQANTALADVAQCVREAIKEDRARRKEIADVRTGLARLQAIRV